MSSKERIKKIVFHWSASGKDTTVEQIREWHKAKGWRDIGYHRVILYPTPNHPGTNWSSIVKQGRHLDNDLYMDESEIGAHAYGFNRNTVGVCVIGNTNYKLHPLQRDAIIGTAKILIERFKLTRGDVIGHRDVSKTQCPGDEIYKLVKDIQKGSV